MKRKLAFLLAASIGLFAGCSTDDNATSTNADSQAGDIQKPKQISMVAQTFMPWKDNEAHINQFSAKYKELTGIDLKVEIPEKEDYYERMNILIATDDSVDVFETGCLFYPNYAMYDLLWDMTDAWENSSIKETTQERYVDSLKINGRLYGFPLNAGNGTVTYVRKDWMDKLNISNPKTYDDFYNMLKAFKSMGEDIIPITGAGLVNSESPYTLYLREFYQDANPDFYLKNGKYVDGMTEPEMLEALKRMEQAFDEGLIDPNIVKNKTSNARDNFYSGKVGCFNYWAGTWGKTITEKIQAAFPGGDVVALKPLEGMKYLERCPLAMVISSNSKNPEAVFKYFIEYSHDSGEGQMLFTHGVENFHWRNNNGKFEHIPENEVSSVYFKSSLSINDFDDPMPEEDIVMKNSQFFLDNSTLAPLPAVSKETANLFSDVDIVRREVIESIVTTDVTIEEGMAEYNARASKLVARVLDNLNSNLDTSENSENESKEG